MFKWLRRHWKVNNRDLFLILCTFAITGTLTAYISRQITGWLDMEKYTFYWWALKVFVLVFGYQFIILIVGFCFGQFNFFWQYEKKILRRMRLLKPETEKSSKAPANQVLNDKGSPG
ncbi:MAG: DUF6787 family protein [Chitinophagaceae bacterium]